MSNNGTENNRNALIEKTIRHHAEMIYRIAFQSLHNRADAEDVLQEVSIALVTKNAPLESEAHIKHWLIKTTLNKCRDLHKSFYRRGTEPLDEHTDIEAPEHKEVLEELFKLPRDYGVIIYLYYYEKYTIAEIGEILGKSPNTVSSSLQRARKKLKNLLLEGGYHNG